MSSKDYSHIKQGMYLNSEDINDEDTCWRVRGAFASGGANLQHDPTITHSSLLRDQYGFYGWDKDGDLYLHSYLAGSGFYTQVTVDFILNGPEKTKEPTTEGNSLADLGKQLFGKKMRVTPETSKLVQEAVFAAGGSWPNLRTDVVDYAISYFFCSINGELTYRVEGETFFEFRELTEVKITPTSFSITELPTKEEIEKQETLKELEGAKKEVERLTEKVKSMEG